MQPRRVGTDFLKTAGAVVLIGAIVVATFLYGNSQRQQQIKRDQTAKKQQERQVVTGTTSADETSSKSASVAPTPTSAASPSSSPAPSPSNSASSSSNTTATDHNAVGGGALPDSGGTAPANMPNTGSEAAYLAPIALIVGLGYMSRSSRRQLRAAALGR